MLRGGGGGRGLSRLREEEFGLGCVREGILGIIKGRRTLAGMVGWGSLSRRSERILSLSLLCEKSSTCSRSSSSSSSSGVLVLTPRILEKGKVGRVLVRRDVWFVGHGAAPQGAEVGGAEEGVSFDFSRAVPVAAAQAGFRLADETERWMC
jgi:hypothetical protein